MVKAQVEHINFTVENPDQTAAVLCQLFDWKVRWSGEAKDNGYSVHVGGEDSYFALYASAQLPQPQNNSYERINGLNHIGLVVNDLDQLQQRVEALGMKPHSFGDYEPGRRFYFKLDSGLEIEAVKYD